LGWAAPAGLRVGWPAGRPAHGDRLAGRRSGWPAQVRSLTCRTRELAAKLAPAASRPTIGPPCCGFSERHNLDDASGQIFLPPGRAVDVQMGTEVCLNAKRAATVGNCGTLSPGCTLIRGVHLVVSLARVGKTWMLLLALRQLSWAPKVD